MGRQPKDQYKRKPDQEEKVSLLMKERIKIEFYSLVFHETPLQLSKATVKALDIEIEGHDDSIRSDPTRTIV